MVTGDVVHADRLADDLGIAAEARVPVLVS